MIWFIAIGFLAAYEAFAIATGRRTLSATAWEANRQWPFLSTLVGLIVGGLLVHFFWLPAGCDPLKGF